MLLFSDVVGKSVTLVNSVKLFDHLDFHSIDNKNKYKNTYKLVNMV